jgi:hypothetical protein
MIDTGGLSEADPQGDKQDRPVAIRLAPCARLESFIVPWTKRRPAEQQRVHRVKQLHGIGVELLVQDCQSISSGAREVAIQRDPSETMIRRMSYSATEARLRDQTAA